MHYQQTGLPPSNPQWQQGGLDLGATQGPPPSNWQQQNRPPLNASTAQGVWHIPHQQVYHDQQPTGQLYPQNTGGGKSYPYMKFHDLYCMLINSATKATSSEVSSKIGEVREAFSYPLLY